MDMEGTGIQNEFYMYHSSNKMVRPIWSNNLMIKKVYEGSMISRLKYQSLKNVKKWMYCGWPKNESEKAKAEKGT